MEWYRIWSDGWIEQGDYPVSNPITLLKPYKNNNYIILLGLYRQGSIGDYAVQYVYDKAETYFKINHVWQGGNQWANQSMWYACGY